MPACKQLRQHNTLSIAAGAQVKVLECGDEATETVALGGEVYDMCRRCATDAVNQFSAVEIKAAQERDAAQLRQYSEIMATGAEVWVSHPEVAGWFGACAVQLEAMAVDVLEGKL